MSYGDTTPEMQAAVRVVTAFKRLVRDVLRRLETEGRDYDGAACPTCGVVESSECCPICLTHNGGKLAGPYRHTDTCALAALLKECGA